MNSQFQRMHCFVVRQVVDEQGPSKSQRQATKALEVLGETCLAYRRIIKSRDIHIIFMRGSLNDLSSRSHSFLTKACILFCYYLCIMPFYKERWLKLIKYPLFVTATLCVSLFIIILGNLPCYPENICIHCHLKVPLYF